MRENGEKNLLDCVIGDPLGGLFHLFLAILSCGYAVFIVRGSLCHEKCRNYFADTPRLFISQVYI